MLAYMYVWLGNAYLLTLAWQSLIKGYPDWWQNRKWKNSFGVNAPAKKILGKTVMNKSKFQYCVARLRWRVTEIALHTWSALNWSPPNADTQGLIPPVPRAINSSPTMGPTLGKRAKKAKNKSNYLKQIPINYTLQSLVHEEAFLGEGSSLILGKKKKKSRKEEKLAGQPKHPPPHPPALPP